MEFMETSALEGTNVNNVFKKLIESLFNCNQ